MCGTGVGWSVEKKYVDQLPTVSIQGDLSEEKEIPTYTVPDSKEGWCDAFLLGLQTWYGGRDINFDFSEIRLAGAPLKVTGGKASGPEPLKELLKFARDTILSRQGAKLTTLDIHDLICYIGKIVVVGGVRRCIAEDSRVLVKDKSFKYIQNVEVGDLVLTDDGYRPVTNTFSQGVQPVLQITHSNGMLCVTDNHRMAVLNSKKKKELNSILRLGADLLQVDLVDDLKLSSYIEWKETKDLTKEDYLIFPGINNEEGNSEEGNNERNKARMFGIFTACGRMNLFHTSLEFVVKNNENLDFIVNQLEQFGAKPEVSTSEDDHVKTFTVSVSEEDIVEYFYESYSRIIPDVVLHGNTNVKIGYLKGLFIDNSRLSIENSMRFVKDVQSLLYSIGIVSRVEGVEVGKLGVFKGVLTVNPDQRDYLISAFNHPTNELSMNYMYANSDGNVTHHFDNGNIRFFLSRVNSLDIAKSVMTYDLEVDGPHCFVVEGVLSHNSAMISISDLNDEEIRKCKQGNFYNDHPQRCMANNSAAYNKVPSDQELMTEWLSLIQSGSGERGIFNRTGLSEHLPERRREWLGERINEIGTNPCGEVYLNSHQTCNLSTVKVDIDDNLDTLLEKIELATILGTYQSCLTNFNYVSSKFKENCEGERLLGVSMTGQHNSPLFNTMLDSKENEEKMSILLGKLKERAISTNLEYSERFGINPSTAITLVKPEGTSSEMLGCSNGVHPYFDEYYVRRVRLSAHDSVFKLLRDQGAIYYPETGSTINDATTFVVEFPLRAPEGCKTIKDWPALKMLEYCRMMKMYYCEHNPSVTVSIGNDEWIDVMVWLKEKWQIIGGLAFLPRYDHVYKLAPFESISKETYEKLVKHYEKNKIDYTKLIYYETEDETKLKTQAACTGPDACYM
jgi:hypothetical protein